MKRMSGFQESPELLRQVEKEVKEQMRNIRSMTSSSQYQEILSSFNQIINRPAEMIRTIN